MPEGLEAEIWRGALERVVGRVVTSASVDDRVAPTNLPAVVVGERIEAVRRRGKVVVIETSGPAIGLHFGMTGRVEVDGNAPILRLAYASGSDLPEWDRLRLHTAPASSTDRRVRGDAPAVRFNDPRRLGRVSLDPDLSRLGPDAVGAAFAGRRGRDLLGDRLLARRSPIKAALLDQAVVAGIGNLCADELLWWAGIDPRRPAVSLQPPEIVALHRALLRRLPVMLRRGGSTTGTLTPEVRASCPVCPRGDGGDLRRSRIGGRTTVWCPAHQR